MPRRRGEGALAAGGVGLGVLLGLLGNRQRKESAKEAVNLEVLKTLLTEQAKEQANPEYPIRKRISELGMESIAPKYGAGQVGPPTADQSTIQSTRQSQIDILSKLLGQMKSSGSSNGVNVFAFDPATRSVQPASGGQNLPRGSRVIPTRIGSEEAERTAAARTRGAQSEKGLAGESAGKLINLQTAFDDLQEAKNILFPDGTPTSQRTDLLQRLGTPLQVGSLVGGEKSDRTDAQKVISRIQNAIAAKLLVQTGVAARPDEIRRLMAQFQPLARLTDEANFDRMNRLEEFLRSGAQVIDPTGRFTKNRETELSPPKLGGRIRVRDRSSGQTGTIPANEFDPTQYQRL